jgi:hypothetical protein
MKENPLQVRILEDKLNEVFFKLEKTRDSPFIRRVSKELYLFKIESKEGATTSRNT